MKLMTYRKALESTPQELAASKIGVRVKRAKKRAELELVKLEEQIADAEHGIAGIAAGVDIDFDVLIDQWDGLSLLERQKEQFEQIIAQMFPE